jgi:hypothetical protein
MYDDVANDYQIEEGIMDKWSRQRIMQMMLNTIQAQIYNIAPYLEQEIIPRDESEVLKLINSQ